MDIKGPTNLLELYAKCCLYGDFSGEIVQGILRSLKTSLTLKEFRIPRFSVILLKVHTNIFRAQAYNFWDQVYFAQFAYHYFSELVNVQLCPTCHLEMLQKIALCYTLIAWRNCSPNIRHTLVSCFFPPHKGC